MHFNGYNKNLIGEKMIVSDRIALFLKEKGIDKVFLYPGGTVAPLINSLNKYSINVICFKNEQGAGYAAIGAAKISGFPQVVVVTSGPGVTNLITPIADSYFDSVPLIILTGQVGTNDINFQGKIRQTGFQEIKTTLLTKCITKFSKIAEIETVENTLSKAYNLAVTGRKGPVLIDLPMDVQQSQCKIIESIKNEPALADFDKKQVIKILDLLQKAEKPIVLAGNGIFQSKTVEKLREFAGKFGLPVVSSLPGIGTIATDNEKFFGFVGHTGEFHANLALKYSDFCLVLGARLDVRQTGSETKDFCENKQIIRVDIDSGELKSGRIKGNVNLNMDLNDFFGIALEEEILNKVNLSSWFNQLRNWKDKYSSNQFYENLKTVSMYQIVKTVDKIIANEKVIVTTGVGTHQHIAARFFRYDYPKRQYFTSAGHGAMGYDIPVCIGAVIEKPDYKGVVFVGDGSLQMNTQELATIKEKNLPVKIFVFDNKRLGLVSQFQKLNWNDDPTTGDKINPDFAKISEAYGIKSFTIDSTDNMEEILEKALKDNEPVVVNCIVSEEEDVLPMLLGGQKLNQMYPFDEEV